MKSPDLICSFYHLTVPLTLICLITYVNNSLLKIYHTPICPQFRNWWSLRLPGTPICFNLFTQTVFLTSEIYCTLSILPVFTPPIPYQQSLVMCNSENGLGTSNMSIILELDRNAAHPDLLTRNLSNKILRLFKVWAVLLRLTSDFISSYLPLETFLDSVH